MLADYGRTSGYGQIAPGKDISPLEDPKRNGRPPGGPDINTAIMGGLPLSETPFVGAQQTLGAMPRGQVGTGAYQPWKETPAQFGGMGAPMTAPEGGGSPPFNPTPTPSPAPVDTSQWKTDNYGTPGYTATSFGNAPAGFDQTKWGDANHQTPKYVVGRILNETGAPSIENLSKAMAHIQAAYPGAQFNGKDKITLPNGEVIDVLTNSGSGQNMSWAWQTGGGATTQGQAQGSPLQSAIMGGAMPTVTGGTDYAAQIREQVMKSLMNQPGLNSLASQYMK